MNKFISLVNRLITHNRDKVGDYGIRVLIHIPVGILMGIPILGKPLRDIFIRYEENEDVHTKDQAWKDYAGAMVGEVITELLLIGILIFILVKLL